MNKGIKRLLVALLIVAIAIPVFASTAGIDLTTMSLEELIQLRNDVDTEISSRISSNNDTMYQGAYVAGKDIAIGRYTFTALETSYLELFDTNDNFKSYRKDYKEEDRAYYNQMKEGDVVTLNLEEGQVVNISRGSGLVTAISSPSWAPQQ